MTDTLSNLDSPKKAYQDRKSERECRKGRSALWAFGIATLAALPLLLWCEHGTWFQLDDWDFLAARTGGDLGDLFRGHNQHWVTLPIVAYRLLWQGFGIHSALPYQALGIVGHLVIAALLLVIMRRAGVRPWLATVSATLLVFFGAGAENILVAFQITFVYAFLFGLIHLLLADHDGAFDRRDWLGLLAGVASLMCSGVAVAMVFVVGLAVLLRRGWQAALAHTAPLAVVYVLWRLAAPSESLPAYYHANSPGGVVRFVAVGFRAGFREMGQLPGIGILIVALLILGLGLCVQKNAKLLRGSAAMVIALLAGALVFLVLTALYRSGTTNGLAVGNNSFGPEHARTSRYVYMVAAMVLPSLAFAGEIIIRTWRRAAIVVFALLLVGLPWNVDKLVRYNDQNRSAFVTARRPYILRAPRLPVARQLPPTLPVATYLTLGWLIDSLPSGRIPSPPPASGATLASETLSLALAPSTPDASAPCKNVLEPIARIIQQNERLTVRGADVDVVYVPVAGPPSAPARIHPSTVVALVGPLSLRIRAAHSNGGTTPVVCG